jgi:hypothetical protein
MTVPLSTAERTKLARVLALLDSPVPGEIIAAAAAANRLISSAGVSWEALLVPQLSSPDLDEDPPRTDGGWRAQAADCRRYRDLLNDWENQFLDGLASFPRPSPKQQRRLAEIVTKLRTCGCRL